VGRDFQTYLKEEEGRKLFSPEKLKVLVLGRCLQTIDDFYPELAARNILPDAYSDQVDDGIVFKVQRAFLPKVWEPVEQKKMDLPNLVGLYASLIKQSMKERDETRFMMISERRAGHRQLRNMPQPEYKEFMNALKREVKLPNNFCLKVKWREHPNPKFSDVVATYLADIKDKEEWTSPEFVSALPLPQTH